MNTSFISLLNCTSLNNPINLYPNYSVRKFISSRVFLYIFGVTIIILNGIVVVSSGVIAIRGQKRKSSYLFLGNVSLADTLIGILIIVGLLADKNDFTPIQCIFNSGSIITPAIVSIYSVFLIAIDRYVYILFGLWYQKWMNTTRVRVAIFCSWVIGIILAFSPTLVGWLTKAKGLHIATCWDLGLSAPKLIILSSLATLLPIVLVFILYAIILSKALKKVDELIKITILNDEKFDRSKKAKTVSFELKASSETSSTDESEIVDEKTNENYKNEINYYQTDESVRASCDNIDRKVDKEKTNTQEAKSIDNGYHVVDKNNDNNLKVRKAEQNAIITDNQDINLQTIQGISKSSNKSKDKPNRTQFGPNKWRAIKLVAFTTGGLLITWVPFFIVKIVYSFCEMSKTECNECRDLKNIFVSTLSLIGKANSLLNPILYAWWHPGFKLAFFKLMGQVRMGFSSSCETSSVNVKHL